MPDGCATDRHGFALSTYVTRPESRGEVRVTSPSPLDRPLIDPQYLSAPADLDLSLASFAVTRAIGGADAFARVRAKEINPGDSVVTREGLTAYIRRPPARCSISAVPARWVWMQWRWSIRCCAPTD
jgi:choline dehydrogenase